MFEMTSDGADRKVPRSDGMVGGDVAPGSHQPPPAPSWKRLLAELKRRHVFRVAAVYGAVGFAVIEVAQAIFSNVGLSETAVTLMVWLVLLGFAVALVLAWAFETTPCGGIRRTAGAEPAVLDAIAAQPTARLGFGTGEERAMTVSSRILGERAFSLRPTSRAGVVAPRG